MGSGNRKIKRVIISANGLTLFEGPSYKRDRACTYEPSLGWSRLEV